MNPVNTAQTPDVTSVMTTNITTQAVLGTLTITGLQAVDAGQYEFVVSNSVGAATSAVVTNRFVVDRSA